MASEDHQEMLNKISQLAGQINRHKNGQVSEQQEQPQSSYGGMQPHAPSVEPYADQATANWVSKNDRGHRQLINPEVYEKGKGPRIKSMEDLRLQRLKRKDQFERARLERFVKVEKSRQVLVDGGVFRVSKGGQKLQRLSGERVLAPEAGSAPTPKTGYVAGVKFYRSKNGNMYRDASIKIHGYDAIQSRKPEASMMRSNNDPAKQSQDDMIQDISSDEDGMGSDDVDSDGLEELFGDEEGEIDEEIPTQQDFVSMR
ncbi:hypothetical protein IFR05_015356 [Cadophora sp. M221]|nr:hypothetical protein IFR05_015356 [Cadophora sp. M221]